MSSRVRLARNLVGFRFMSGASREDRREILDVCRRALLNAGLAERLAWVDLHECGTQERTLLVERHVISKQHAKGKLSSGTGGAGEPRGVAFSVPDERLSVMVNEEDHLRIQTIHAGLDLAGAFAACDRADDLLERGLDFAFSPRFGYLTCCPTNVGTGARFSVMLHLPALRLTGEVEKAKRAGEDIGLAVRGFFGEGSDAVGDFFQFSNQTTLGKSEDVLRHEMEHEIVPRLVEYERQARRALLERRRRMTEDAVQRALGTLRHARLLTADEAMKSLSLVRLGVVMGVLGEVTLDTVHLLMLLVQQAHLQQVRGRELTQDERRAARADLVRERLGGA